MRFRGINLQELRYLIDRNGYSPRELSLLIGRGEGYVGDLLRGKKKLDTMEVGSLFKLAEVLKSTTFLGLEFDDLPKSVWEQCPARWSLFSVPEAKTAVSWLTYTRCAYTYFFPLPMRQWFQQIAYRRLGWSEEDIRDYTRETQNFSDTHLECHQQGRSVHRLIIQENIFVDAAKEDREWIHSVCKTLRALDGRTIVSLTPDELWLHVKRTIAKYCEWTDPCSIDVIDKAVVIVRPNCGGPHMISRDPATVAGIQQAIELTNPCSGILNISHKFSIDRLTNIACTAAARLGRKKPR